MSIDWDSVDLASRVEEGHSSLRVAFDLGVTDSSVRSAALRRGINFSERPTPIETAREIAESLPPRKAVEYLLNALECIAPWTLPNHHELDDWGVDFTSTERRLLMVLCERRGCLVTRQQLFSALYFDRQDCDLPAEKIMDVLICKVRRKLPSWCQIQTEWGRGWTLTISRHEGNGGQE